MDPTFSDSLAQMPWLVHPFREGMAIDLLKLVFKELPWSALVAFGEDGTLLTKSGDVLLRKMRPFGFPFVSNLEKSTLEELSSVYGYSGWILEE